MKAKWFLGAIALLFVGGFTACNGSDPQAEIEFPDKKTLDVQAGTHGVFSFDAPAAWKLTVLGEEDTWLRLTENNTDKVGAVSAEGVAGQGSVNYYVSDAGLDLNDLTVEVQLTMDGKDKVIFEVKRLGINKDVVMYIKPTLGDAYMAESLDFVFGGRDAGSFNISFKAKYDWKVISVPDGVECSLPFTGVMYTEPTAWQYVSIKTDKLSSALPADSKIIVGNLAGDKTVEIPVTYAGMGDTDMIVSPISLTSRGASFSKDGYVLQAGTGEPTTDKWVSGQIYVKDMNYGMYVVEVDFANFAVKNITTGVNKWVTTDKGGNTGEIAFGVTDNTGAAREAYVLVLPKAYADNPQLDDFEKVVVTYLDMGRDLNPGLKPTGKKYGFKVTQEAGAVAASGGIFAGWGPSSTSVGDLKTLHDAFGMTPSDFSSYLPDDNTWVYQFTDSDVNGSMVVVPLGFPTQDYYAEWTRLQSYLGSWTGIVPEAGTNVYGVGMGVRLPVTTNAGANRMAFLLFYDNEDDMIMNKRAKAALVLIQNE